MFRFIDNLNQENIKNSPLKLYTETALLSDKHFPPKSSLISDLGKGHNPFGIKRKLKLGQRELNIIFAPPKSTYIFNHYLSKASVLEFGIGIIKNEDSRNPHFIVENKEKGVNFLIVLEIKGKKKIVFQKYLNFQSNKQKYIFSQHRIFLPFSTKEAQFSLVTEGNSKKFSFWYNPVLYNKGKNNRNIILISVDTLRADHLGCYGYNRKTSPNIDSLVSDSVLFLNTYAPSPWTLPSHISMLTSLYDVHHQVYYEYEKMDSSIITLADILRNNNFFCSAFTGGGFVSSNYGFSKGFDSYREITQGIYFNNSPEHIYKSASKWLDYNKDKNFFLFIHTYQPHNPYDCPHPYNRMFIDHNAKWQNLDLLRYIGGKKGIFKKLSEEERKNIISLYDAEIRYTDEYLIKPLIEKLKNMSFYDHTMIIFTSDHGEEFYDHKSWEHANSLYNEQLKVPLIIKFPYSRFAGKKIKNIVRLVDIMPTVLEELRLESPKLKLDGQSLIPLIKGKKQKERVFLAEKADNILDSHIPQKLSMNLEKYKLIINKKYKAEDLSFFLFPPPNSKHVELYDLDKDPLEKNNIADENPKIVNQIINQINAIYRNAKKRKKEKTEIDDTLREQLKALGYIH